MTSRLYDFIHALDPHQRTRFEDFSGTTIANVRHYITGKRVPSSETAIAIELAATKLRKRDLTLPPLSRRDLSPACRDCEFAKACTARLA
jgi:hypothetical protein